MEISVEQMYKIENNGHAMGFLKKFMMENAGAASVKRLAEKVDLDSKNVLIFVGLGNNGGDGLVMARHLAGYDAKVTVVLLGTPDKIKTEESKWNWSILQKMPSIKLVSGNELPNFNFIPDVIVDGILGTGITGEIKEPYASAINFINASNSYKFAVDVPSGLNPDTGETANICVKSDMTVTFHKMKRGIPKRKDLTGVLFVEKIGIPPEAEKGVL